MANVQCMCANFCSGSAPCICMFSHASGNCYCCCDGKVPLAMEPPDRTQKVALDRGVNVDMRGASLGEAGKLLADIANAEIYVPAERIDEQRMMNLQEVSLETVVRELGLMASYDPDPARRSPRDCERPAGQRHFWHTQTQSEPATASQKLALPTPKARRLRGLRRGRRRFGCARSCRR